MAQKNGDKSSLVDDFNHQHAPPQYELSSPAPTYPQPPVPTYPAAPGAQHNVVVVPQPMVMAREPLPDATGAIVLSCVVFWCCGCLFGLVAFIVALMATSAPNAQSARSSIKASYILSTVGIVISVVLTIIFIIWYVVTVVTVVNAIEDDIDSWEMDLGSGFGLASSTPRADSWWDDY